mmetsp:Transcript_47102/g.130890  ORF Transcript_47102/g.130890 Transcript_47102/m.130890 type:complete len:251 (+) Transcript_47102:235-987(+)
MQGTLVRCAPAATKKAIFASSLARSLLEEARAVAAPPQSRAAKTNRDRATLAAVKSDTLATLQPHGQSCRMHPSRRPSPPLTRLARTPHQHISSRRRPSPLPPHPCAPHRQPPPAASTRSLHPQPPRAASTRPLEVAARSLEVAARLLLQVRRLGVQRRHLGRRALRLRAQVLLLLLCRRKPLVGLADDHAPIDRRLLRQRLRRLGRCLHGVVRRFLDRAHLTLELGRLGLGCLQRLRHLLQLLLVRLLR